MCAVAVCSGRYTVQVLYAGVDVGGSPAYPEVFDSSLVRVGQIDDGILGQPIRFQGLCVIFTIPYLSRIS